MKSAMVRRVLNFTRPAPLVAMKKLFKFLFLSAALGAFGFVVITSARTHAVGAVRVNGQWVAIEAVDFGKTYAVELGFAKRGPYRYYTLATGPDDTFRGARVRLFGDENAMRCELSSATSQTSAYWDARAERFTVSGLGTAEEGARKYAILKTTYRPGTVPPKPADAKLIFERVLKD
jgi:hypothetical protein